MKPRSAKAKGAKLQNDVALLLRKYTGLDKGQASNHEGDIQGRSLGSQGTDVVLSPRAKELIPFDIECKNAESWHINDWWDQTVANTAKDRIPLLIMKKNRMKPLIAMDMNDFFRLFFKKQ